MSTDDSIDILIQRRCPRCGKTVTIPDGRPGAFCPKCGYTVLLDERQRRSRRRPTSPYLRIGLVVAILALVGVWLYVGPLAPEPEIDLDGQARAASAAPRRFSLWELHPDDTVRVIELFTTSGAEGARVQVNSPSLRSGDEVLALEPIGGRLVGQTTHEDVYGGINYLKIQYTLRASRDRYGYDMRLDRPPHLHINGAERLISLGIDPKSFAQEIFAVAIPVDARLRRIYDYQPYRRVTMAGWDIFYYDVTDIQTHISIHITYRPADDAPPLDWTAVEAAR